MTVVVDKRRRGRPLGFRLSDSSKRAISVAKTGQKHSQETKDKISRSLALYFRKKNLFSDEIMNRYCRTEDEYICNWISDVHDELDASEDILPTKLLNNKTKIELTCGNNIEYLNHSMTPEFIVILKEEIININSEETRELLRRIIE
jgi:hypothetical protein